ncbi:MAG: hypothetical protein C0597_00035 [Marinilabiliales bacterium]|nr:MAG: hypothetical protein C0597_00035 [Marinilabiliales bacterium]
MKTRKPKIKTFYTSKMALSEISENTSESPQKPRRIIEYLNQQNLINHFQIIDNFLPFEKQDFYIAHHQEYVDSFFSEELNRRYRRMLGIKWSKEFADTTRYTNASFYNAILSSIKDPDTICFSPTSGFHHATPKFGGFFCSFSGQVIASTKIYRDLGLSGAYIDLDAHHGNSIDNSYDYISDLHLAIPPEIGNINIEGKNTEYLTNLELELEKLKKWIVEKKIHYLVFCHGADSCEEDDLGRLLTKNEWLECSRIFYNFVANLDNTHGIKIPLAISLFGGYNKKDFNKVLDLHAQDLMICIKTLCT